MHRSVRLSLSLLFFGVLAAGVTAIGYAGPSAEESSGPMIGTRTRTIIPTGTLTSTPVPTNTFTATLTNTPVPTNTATSTPLPSSTSAPTQTATPKATSTTQPANCQITSEGFPNLIDLGTGTWQGYQGGLWPNGSNQIPASYGEIGLQHAASIVPRNSQGVPDPTGKIAFISIGMSNTQKESDYFASTEVTDTLKKPSMLFFNDAQSNVGTADQIIDPKSEYWTYVEYIITSNNVTDSQVQAIWLKETINYGRNPIVPFPTDAQNLQSDLAIIVSILEGKFPNLQIIYLSSRIYAGYSSVKISPEPSAYDSGYAVKWLIQDRINGVTSGPSWLTWGPYMWADGINPRSDGLQWFCEDFDPTDGAHPSTSGKQKVYGMLMNMLATDPTASRWYFAATATPTPVAGPQGGSRE